jgi:hypothetical protein
MLLAFGILFTVTLIYSVLGVSFFADISPGKFLDLKTALLTMFGVAMGDLSVAYDLFELGPIAAKGDDERRAAGGGGAGGEEAVPITNPLIAFFFISYMLIGSVLLLNVVVAVLLDEFIANVVREKEAAEAAAEEIRAKRRIMGVLDPITLSLTGFQDAADLKDKCDVIFDQLDTDQGNSLSFLEFRNGIKNLPGTENIHLTLDDFELITEYGAHLNAESGNFNKDQFHAMMKQELNRFAFRNMTNVLKERHVASICIQDVH